MWTLLREQENHHKPHNSLAQWYCYTRSIMSVTFDRHILGGAGKVISLDVHGAEYRLWHT